MDAKTLEALKASIAKWERNAEVKDIEDAKTSIMSCPLCLLFFDQKCYWCPVYSRTTETACKETPYYDAANARDRSDIEAFRTAARAEVEFLKSLLPEGK